MLGPSGDPCCNLACNSHFSRVLPQACQRHLLTMFNIIFDGFSLYFRTVNRSCFSENGFQTAVLANAEQNEALQATIAGASNSTHTQHPTRDKTTFQQLKGQTGNRALPRLSICLAWQGDERCQGFLRASFRIPVTGCLFHTQPPLAEHACSLTACPTPRSRERRFLIAPTVRTVNEFLHTNPFASWMN